MRTASSALLDALSKAFSYPWEGMEPTTAALESLSAAEAGGFADDVRDVLRASRAFESTTSAQLAYTRLFIGSFKMEAPPYASYYLDGEQQVDGPTTAQVRGVYAQFGLQVSEDEKAPADHLRYLLAFLALLAGRYEETGEAAFAEAYADFRDDYVLSWSDAFQKLVETYAEDDYYKMLVALIISAVKAGGGQGREGGEHA